MEVHAPPPSNSKALQQLLAAEQAAGPAADGEALRRLRALTSTVLASVKGRGLDDSQLRELLAGAYALWNSALELQNGGGATPQRVATSKQCASDLCTAARTEDQPLSVTVGMATIHLRAGEAWAELGEREAAAAALARALEFGPALKEASFERRAWGPAEVEAGELLFRATLAAMDTALHLNQQANAGELQRRAAALATSPRVPPREGAALKVELVHALRDHGRRLLLACKDGEAIPLLDAAYELLSSLQGEGEDAAADLAPEGTAEMVSAVLLLLAHAYGCSPGNEQRARNCAEALRQLEGQAGQAGGSVAGQFFLAQALLRGGSPTEAEAEVLDLFNHEEATADMCACVVASMLESPQGLAMARSALSVALGRFPDEACVSYGLLSRVLGGSEDPGAEAESLVLEVVGDDRVCEVLCEDAALGEMARALVWNHATRRLQEGRFESALSFFGAALRLAEQAGAAEADRATGLRSQALCCLALSRHDRALQFLDEAEQAEKGSLPTAFARLQVHLGAGDAAGAAAALTWLAECAGEHALEVIRLACVEAVEARLPSVVKQALLLLLERAAAAGDGTAAAAPPGYEATIFQNLINVTLEQGSAEAAAQPDAAGAADVAAAAAKPGSDGGAGAGVGAAAEGGGGSGGPAAGAGSGALSEETLAELAKAFDQMMDRAKVVGAEAFFGLDQGGRPAQLEWFAAAAWNAACASAQRGRRDQAAVLMGASGELSALHPAPSAAVLSRRKMAFLMAASLTADVATDFAGALSLARRYLASARQAQQAAAEAGLAAAGGDKIDVYLLLTEFELAHQAGDVPAQLAAVGRAAAVPSFSADHYAKMAAFASKVGPNRSAEVCAAVHRAALQALTAQAAPNYSAMAVVLRSLLDLCTGDPERLALLAEAAGLLDAAPQGAYPALEVQWLVVKAWNLGALRRKFEGPAGAPGAAGGKDASGAAFQRAALAMLPHCPALLSKKEMMVEELQKAEASAGEAGGGGGGAMEVDAAA